MKPHIQDRATGGNCDRPGNNVSAQLVGTECRIALQTAQALIKRGTQGRVRVLFDSGRDRSFVTAKAALKYELPVERKEWITVSTFGQTGKESGLRKVVRFDKMPLLWRSCAGARSLCRAGSLTHKQRAW